MTRRRRRTPFFAGGLAVAIAAAVVSGALELTKKTAPVVPPATTVSAEDRTASRSLIEAAHAVGFLPTTAPGVGQIEGKPAAVPLPKSSTSLLAPGTAAPAFALRTPTGQTVSLASFRGKAVLLEFFATWCPHCNAEAPHVRTLSTTLSAARYAFASIDADGETAPSVFAFHLYYGFEFPALLDPSSRPGSFHSPGGSGPASSAYRVRTFPTFYVIDPQGKVAWAAEGEQPDALLRAELMRAA